jgi:drug/metabolite transporter (DMT)-like permease
VGWFVKTSLLLGFALLVAVDTTCQVGFKLAADATAPPHIDLAWVLRVLTEPWVYLVIAGYVIAFLLYMTILRVAPVGPAFAATHLEIVTVLFFSVLFLGESLSITQIVGSLAVITGVVVLGCTETHG